MPQNSTRNWYAFGTPKNEKITAQTKTLSIDSDFSIRKPEMYSVAAWPPCQPSTRPVNASPIEIQTADSIAASFTLSKIDARSSSIEPMTKQLNRVTLRPVPAPARSGRPDGARR